MSIEETLKNIEKSERELWAAKAKERTLETISQTEGCRPIHVLRFLESYVALNYNDPAVMGAHGLDMDYVSALIRGLKDDNLIEINEDGVISIKK